MEKLLIGKGRTAAAYEIKNNRVLKLYEKSVSKKYIEKEFQANKLAMELKAKVPKVYDLVVEETKNGIVFEKIDGIALKDLLSTKLFKTKFLAKNFAKSLLSIHFIDIDNQLEHIDYVSRISSISFIDETSKNKIIEYTNSLQKGKKLCHGDYHVDNVLVSNNNFYVIDWMNAYKGSPLEEVAKVCLLLDTPFGKKNMSSFMKLVSRFVIYKFKKAFLKEYFDKSEYNIEDVNKWLLPVACNRLLEEVPLEKEWLLKMINKELKNL